MSNTTLSFLSGRLAKADQRWLVAMKRPGYKDDPQDEGPFSERDWDLWEWANAWRLEVHRIENELDELPEFRRQVAMASSFRAVEATYVEPLMNTEQLANHTKILRTGSQSGKRSHKAKSR